MEAKYQFCSLGKLLVELLDHRYAIEKLAFSPRNSVWHSLLLSCSGDSTLKLWDLYDGGNMYRTLKDHLSGEHVLCCAWSSNGRWAASGGTDHRLIVWRTNCWCSPHSSYRLGSCVIDCDFSPDSALLVSCSCDSMAIVFDHVNNYPLVTLP
ncbi:WD40 domain containing protein [Trichuris trichiura]|uniref:WD40 domain containing protein n=1 Tax=Trichuris trichiura TaxID=36087 RepID=A0A077ZFK6_TRITR|nr:WD40 domain containing protein [Trichuris trichiura]